VENINGYAEVLSSAQLKIQCQSCSTIVDSVAGLRKHFGGLDVFQPPTCNLLRFHYEKEQKRHGTYDFFVKKYHEKKKQNDKDLEARLDEDEEKQKMRMQQEELKLDPWEAEKIKFEQARLRASSGVKKSSKGGPLSEQAVSDELPRNWDYTMLMQMKEDR